MIYKRTRKQPDGTTTTDEGWTIVVTMPGGRRVTRTFHGTRRDAERTEADLRAAAEDQRWAEIDRTRRRAVETLQPLAEAWLAAGMPKAGGRPRTEIQVKRLKPFLEAALRWWGGKSVASIGPRDFTAFGEYKRLHARTGTGERVADLELIALHALCLWAVSTGTLRTNPFADRPRFRAAEDVQHCTTSMPADDDELHRLLGTMFAAGGQARVAGAHLLFLAFTGMRPGEPGALRWDAAPYQPGHQLVVQRDGAEVPLLYIRRLKGGTNPAVRLHAPLAMFLAAWRRFTLATWPQSPWLFPDPKNPTRPLVPFGRSSDSHLSRLLQATARGLGLPPRKPHGMRAYYVRVRRSQGVDDATIAVELGQGSGPGLVVRTYGERLAILGGDGLFDWMPSDPATPPCWARLEAATPTNVVPMSRVA